MAGAPLTLVDLLTRAARVPDAGLRFLDRQERERWIAWPAMLERARGVAGGLQAIGVRRGDFVALVFPTEPEFLDAFFGTVLAGAVPAPLYPPVQLGRLDEYLRRTSSMVRASGARLILANWRVGGLLGEVVRRSRPALGCLALDQLPEGTSDLPDVGPLDLALVQFSSGTTAEPKPVALSHRAVVSQATLLNSYWPGRDGPESGVSWLPLYHDMGLVGTIFTALERPGSVTLIPPELFVARPAVWLRAISRYRATVSPAPNFAYAHAVARIEDGELDGVDLSSWRVALCGGETVVPRVLRAFAERFAGWGFRAEALTPVYGMSEATLAVTFSDLERPFRSQRVNRARLALDGAVERDADGVELVSLGRPVPGFEIRIVGNEGTALPDGRLGVVECRGPSVMDGYLGQPDGTAKVIRDGWLDTGDLGFLLDGDLYVSGRAKDMLLIRGRNYAPDDVERTVDAVPRVRPGRSVAVSWLPEAAYGEELYLFVEAARGVPASEFDAIARASSEAVIAATGLAPDRVLVLEPGTLPRTTSGKLRRQETLSRFLDGALSAPRAVTPLRLAGAVARSWLAYRQTRTRGSTGDPDA